MMRVVIEVGGVVEGVLFDIFLRLRSAEAEMAAQIAAVYMALPPGQQFSQPQVFLFVVVLMLLHRFVP